MHWNVNTWLKALVPSPVASLLVINPDKNKINNKLRYSSILTSIFFRYGWLSWSVRDFFAGNNNLYCSSWCLFRWHCKPLVFDCSIFNFWVGTLASEHILQFPYYKSTIQDNRFELKILIITLMASRCQSCFIICLELVIWLVYTLSTHARYVIIRIQKNSSE